MSAVLANREIKLPRQDSLAEGPGFEPRLTESESAILPLNYPHPMEGEVRYDVSEARKLKTLKTENARLKMLLSLPSASTFL
jgi:hypothetical protein